VNRASQELIAMEERPGAVLLEMSADMAVEWCKDVAMVQCYPIEISVGLSLAIDLASDYLFSGRRIVHDRARLHERPRDRPDLS